jgi:hypothetical protein
VRLKWLRRAGVIAVLLELFVFGVTYPIYFVAQRDFNAALAAGAAGQGHAVTAAAIGVVAGVPSLIAFVLFLLTLPLWLAFELMATQERRATRKRDDAQLRKEVDAYMRSREDGY